MIGLKKLNLTNLEKSFIDRFDLNYKGISKRSRYKLSAANVEYLANESVYPNRIPVIEEDVLIFEISVDDFKFLVSEFDNFRRHISSNLAENGSVFDYLVQKDKLKHREKLLREKYPTVMDLYEKYQAMLALVQSDNDLGE